MATRIKGQSKKEREGHSDNDGTVSFLRLPFLILGDGGGVGSAVECGVLHDDTVADIVFCFVRCFGYRQNIFYMTIGCFCTRTQQQPKQFIRKIRLLICARYRRTRSTNNICTIFPFPLNMKKRKPYVM